MKVIDTIFVGLILNVALVGCAQIANQPGMPLINESAQIKILQEPDNLGELMRYYSWLQTQSNEVLTEEYQYANNHYRDSIDIQQRFKLAILLLLPNTEFYDIHGALDLIENLPNQNKITPATIGFKDILVLLLEQQQTANIKIRYLSAKLRTTEVEVKTLQEKIEAIKNIEKNMMRKDTL